MLNKYAANALVATVLGSIPASIGTVEWAADEAVLNKVREKNPPINYLKKKCSDYTEIAQGDYRDQEDFWTSHQIRIIVRFGLDFYEIYSTLHASSATIQIRLCRSMLELNPGHSCDFGIGSVDARLDLISQNNYSYKIVD